MKLNLKRIASVSIENLQKAIFNWSKKEVKFYPTPEEDLLVVEVKLYGNQKKSFLELVERCGWYAEKIEEGAFYLYKKRPEALRVKDLPEKLYHFSKLENKNKILKNGKYLRRV